MASYDIIQSSDLVDRQGVLRQRKMAIGFVKNKRSLTFSTTFPTCIRTSFLNTLSTLVLLNPPFAARDQPPVFMDS